MNQLPAENKDIHPHHTRLIPKMLLAIRSLRYIACLGKMLFTQKTYFCVTLAHTKLRQKRLIASGWSGVCQGDFFSLCVLCLQGQLSPFSPLKSCNLFMIAICFLMLFSRAPHIGIPSVRLADLSARELVLGGWALHLVWVAHVFLGICLRRHLLATLLTHTRSIIWGKL